MKLTLTFLLLFSFYANAQREPVLTLREQANFIDEVALDRIDHLLPQLMKETGIDCWVVISREYNEDPIIKTMLPATWHAARRRTILVYFSKGLNGGFEKLAISRYNVGNLVPAAWDMEKFPDQMAQLVDIIQKRNPQKIGLNYSNSFGHADGIDHTEFVEIQNRLPQPLKSRICSSEPLAVAWLETRTEKEMAVYPQLVRITHDIVAEGFSEKVITPGITTTDDVVWWFRQKFSDMGLDTWFHTSVDIQRSDSVEFEHLRSFANRPKDQVIMPGDLIHVDIGITYLKLNTDVQQHAYILKPGETAAPPSLKAAFVRGNAVQDQLTNQFKNGKSGNQILADALAGCKAAGLEGVIYTHPIGYHGHAAGPTIGMWDNQKRIEGSGDYLLRPNTAYSIELNCSTYIPEWKKSIRIMLEEDGYWDGNTFRYIGGRQKEMYLVPRVK